MFPFENIKRGVFLLTKSRIINSMGADMHIGKLLIYFGDYIEDIGTLITEKWLGSISKTELMIMSW